MRLIYLLLLLPYTLLAQQTGWQELTISDGLSQGMIFDLAQDHTGYIWVATKDGLNRYDGHNFRVFTHDPYNPFSLSDNSCSALLVDRHKRLWIGTLTRGLNLFDDRTQRFYHIRVSDQPGPNAGNYDIRVITEDPDGNIWIGTDKNKIFKITLPRDKLPDQADLTDRVQIQTLDISTAASMNTIFSFSFQPDGRAFLGAAYGVYRFDWRHPTRTYELDFTMKEPLDFHAVYTDPERDLWFASTRDRIIGWHKGQQKSIALPHNNYVGVQIQSIDRNTLAIATPDHLWIMSPAELFSQTRLSPETAFVALPAHVYSITNLLRDRTGNIWVGTSGYGLRRFNPIIRQFSSYLANHSLSNLFVDRQGHIYARHQFAYGQLERASNTLRPFLDERLAAADKRQRFMMQDSHGFFWVSNVNFMTHENQLFKFSPDWKLLKKFPLPANVTFGFYGNYTVEDRVGNLWIGAVDGRLLTFNTHTETFGVLSYDSLLPRSGAVIETYALQFDPAGTLWIGTQSGLVRVAHPLDKPAFSIYKTIPTDRQSLSHDFITCLIDDPQQPQRYLWVGTKGGGLERLDKQTGRFTHFTEAQGLPNRVIYGLLSDASGMLWLSTNRGLSQFNPRTGSFRNFSKADGLQDDEFNTCSFYKTPSGELLFGGVNGLNSFRPENLVRKTGAAPQAHIIGLKVNNEVVTVGGADGLLAQSIDYTQRLDLSPTQTLLTLEFGLMDYSHSTRNRYRYRLEGIDRNWVEAGTVRFANYAQLPYGQYTFQMMGSADGEVWSRPVTLAIHVQPPFYRTWWAYQLYIGLLLLLGWLLYRFQQQRWLLRQQVLFEQKEAARLAELDAFKTQFFTNISHEFRTPLTLILGPIEQAMQDYAHDARFPLVHRNANRLLSLINQVLDISKLDAGQLIPRYEPGNLASFLRLLASSYRSLAESRQILFSFEQNEPDRWARFDADKIEKIVTNLLTNAFKFTPAGHQVWMQVRYPAPGLSGSWELCVQDTGIGIAPTHLKHIFERFYQIDGKIGWSVEGTGIGLALVSELVSVLDGTIDVDSTEGVGTTFTVRLPLVNATTPPADTAAAASPAPTESPYRVVSDRTAVRSAHLLPVIHDNLLLIVDDNADIRTYIRSIFETDYQVLEAADGLEGLECATTCLPDIVICDLMMPRLDGFSFCSTLKSQDSTSHIPIVMLTAKATPEDRIDGFRRGADEYLTKPFNRAEITVRVQNLVQNQVRLRQYLTGQRQVPSPTQAPMTARELDFLQRVRLTINSQLANSSFDVGQLSTTVSMSQRQLVRKLKALTGQTAVEFIRNQRLDHAAELLAQGRYSVSEVAYQVGFESLPYFTKVFQDKFGRLPSSYVPARHFDV